MTQRKHKSAQPARTSVRPAHASLRSASSTGKERPWRSLFVALVLLAAGLVAVLLWPWRDGDLPATSLGRLVAPGAAAGYNLLLISLDTTRQDRLGCYGYAAAHTPAIDGLLAHGVRFDDAVASVPVTLPSHATLLTGLDPPRHGVRDNGLYKLAPEQVTLAERLAGHGYETAAFLGCFVLDARFGLDQGFTIYDFQVTTAGYRPRMPDFNERAADAVTTAAITWLDGRPRTGTRLPFFLWVHYFDPHLPYSSPLALLPEFSGRPYDAEIAFVDQQLARLLTALDRLALRQRTLIILVADHGEALGDHGEPTHGMLLYEATVRVPLILSCPSLFARGWRIDDRVVGLVDVVPTLCELLGVTLEAGECDGISLLGEDPGTDRAVYLETETPLNQAGWSPLFGLRTHTAKYVLAPTPEFYDLQADPGETRNIHDRSPATLTALQKALPARMTDAATTTGEGQTSMNAAAAAERVLDDEEIQRLGSLGYVQLKRRGTDGPLPDPKRMMPVFNQALRAEELYGQGRYTEAADLAEQVLDRCEGCAQAARVLAFSYLRLDRPAAAIALLRESVARGQDVFLIRSLVQALIIDEQYTAAEQVLDLYAEVAPDDGRVPLLRGDCRGRLGHTAEALALYEEAIRLDENRVGITARERILRVRAQ